MAATIDSMMYVDEVPWHRLGTRLDNPGNAEEAMRAAGLGWDVQLQPLYTGAERSVKIRDRFSVCRVDRLNEADGGQLGVVGRDYTPLQNRDAFSFLDPLVGATATIFHTAGALRGGRRIWVLAKLPGEIRVIGDDIAQKYIILSNSHDGSSAVKVGLTPIRVVCQNTLNLALRSMGGLSIHHHAGVTQRVRQAHELLGLVNEGFKEAGEAFQRMARTPVTTNRLKHYFEAVSPLPIDDEQAKEKVTQRHDRWRELFETGIGQDMPGVGGTVWAGYNAITQYIDRESWTKRNKEPLNTIWFGEGERLKRTAYDQAVLLMKDSVN